jgi:hypothetical protein
MTIKPLGSGSLSMSEINAEFGLGTNLGAYRGVTWYTDAGGSGTFPSTNLAMSAFYGKRKNAPGSLTGSPNSGSGFDDTFFGSASEGTPSISLTFRPNGTWDTVALLSGDSVQGNWFNPTTTSIGNNYSIRFTRTGIFGFSGTSTASTSWLPLTSARTISVSRTVTGQGTYYALYTIEIGTNAGSVLVSSTNVTLLAEKTI